MERDTIFRRLARMFGEAFEDDMVMPKDEEHNRRKELSTDAFDMRSGAEMASLPQNEVLKEYAEQTFWEPSEPMRLFAMDEGAREKADADRFAAHADESRGIWGLPSAVSEKGDGVDSIFREIFAQKEPRGYGEAILFEDQKKGKAMENQEFGGKRRFDLLAGGEQNAERALNKICALLEKNQMEFAGGMPDISVSIERMEEKADVDALIAALSSKLWEARQTGRQHMSEW